MHSDEKESFSPLLLTFAIIAIAVLSTVLFVRHFDLKANLLKIFPKKDSYSSYNEVYEIKMPSERLPVSRKGPETIRFSEMDELRRLFAEEQFEQLNSVLAQYQEIFENDQADEDKVYDAYGVFGYTDASYEDLYKKWISANPETYQPYLAIAKFYYLKGWKSRGNKWAKDTSQKQFDDMRLYFKKAEENLHTALGINPNLIVAYDILFGIYNATGEDELTDRMIVKVNQLFPFSFLIKSTIMWTKEPRWGGSYPQMEAVARQAQKFSDKNPRMGLLYGFIYTDQATRFARNKQYEKALELYTKAIEFGDHSSFYEERSRIRYYNLKLYDQAIEDINRGIELSPTSYKYYILRSKIYYSKKEYDASFNDLLISEKIRPGNSQAKDWRKWATENLVKWGNHVFKEDLQKAVEYYGYSLEFDDNNFQAYLWRGSAKARLNDLDSAESDLKTAIKINPHHFKSYHVMDYALAKQKRWDEIIRYWDAFIELEPGHAEAYFERSGTHYHNKDMVNAMLDLKKACKLGSKEACRQYETVKK